MVEVALKLLTVLGLGAIELWAAIPTGLALGIHPLLTGLAAGVGAVLGVLVVLALGGGVRAWLLSRHGGGGAERHGAVYRIWSRYGVMGLGLLAPLLVGTPLGTVLGVTLGAPSRRLLLGMALGIAVWSTLLTIAGTVGLAGVQSLWH